MTLYLDKLICPPPKNALCQVWLNSLSGSGKEDENVKSYNNADNDDENNNNDDDDGQRKAHLSLRLNNGSDH